MKAGTAVADDNVAIEVVQIGGLGRIRFYFEADVPGTLTGEYLRAGADPEAGAAAEVYDTDAFAAAAIVADTEKVISLSTHHGEEFLRLTFTPDAAEVGEIVHADMCGASL